jgi:hypothetical protein
MWMFLDIWFHDTQQMTDEQIRAAINVYTANVNVSKHKVSWIGLKQYGRVNKKTHREKFTHFNRSEIFYFQIADVEGKWGLGMNVLREQNDWILLFLWRTWICLADCWDWSAVLEGREDLDCQKLWQQSLLRGQSVRK